MSKLRPEVVTASADTPCPEYADALYLIRESVRASDGLIHGKLDGPNGQHCAIGTYFAAHPKTALYNSVIDEVASVNDAYRGSSLRLRKRKVLAFLNFKIKCLLAGVK